MERRAGFQGRQAGFGRICLGQCRSLGWRPWHGLSLGSNWACRNCETAELRTAELSTAELRTAGLRTAGLWNWGLQNRRTGDRQDETDSASVPVPYSSLQSRVRGGKTQS